MKKLNLASLLLFLFLLPLPAAAHPPQLASSQTLVPESQPAIDLVYLYAGQGNAVSRVPAPRHIPAAPTVTIRANDPGGMSAERTFNVTVASQLYYHFLPITP
jgi:hypothetical protein